MLKRSQQGIRDRIDKGYHYITHTFCSLQYRGHVSPDDILEPISVPRPVLLKRDTQHLHVVHKVSCYQCLSLVMLFGLATLSLSSRLT